MEGAADAEWLLGVEDRVFLLAEMSRSRSRPARWLERTVFKAGLIRGQGARKPQRLHLESVQSERELKLVCSVWTLKLNSILRKPGEKFAPRLFFI